MPTAILNKEIAALRDCSRDHLAALWVKAYGCSPPKGVKRDLLERSAVWHLQARRLGGHNKVVQRHLKDLVRARLRETAADRVAFPAADDHPAYSPPAPTDTGVAKGAATPPQSDVARSTLRSAPKPGSRLVREWNGRTYVVDVLASGFGFDNKIYRSLTAIAKKITGTNWSGPRFFGLQGRA